MRLTRQKRCRKCIKEPGLKAGRKSASLLEKAPLYPTFGTDDLVVSFGEENISTFPGKSSLLPRLSQHHSISASWPHLSPDGCGYADIISSEQDLSSP